MRVLHLLSSTGFHGAENMAAALIRQLAACGVENHVGIFRSHEGSNTELLQVVREVIQGGEIIDCHGKFDWRAFRVLRRYVREHKIDVVHSHKYKTNFYAVVACFGLPSALVSTCHNWLGTGAKMRFYAALDKRILRMFDRVVGVSNEVTIELRRHMVAEKVVKIDNGIEVQRFGGTPKSEALRMLGLGARPVVGFVGRLSADKAVSHLLQAARALVSRGLAIDLVVTGDGECAQSLHAEARDLGVGEYVHFLGRRDDTPAIYAAMDVFVLPSLKEAFPMVLLEAMAAGVPVVATEVGDASYILEDGACGVLVEAGDIAALSHAIEKLLTDSDKARRLGSAGRWRVRQRFSSIAMAERYRELYKDALGIRCGVS